MTRKKILLAEDDRDDRELFENFLRQRSDLLLLEPAENGDILMRLLDAQPGADALPDAIVLDQNMPKCNGLQTLERIKSSSRYAHIPVMIYTTYADQTLERRSIDLGATLVKSKPSDRQGYHRMMDEFLALI